MPGKPSTDVSAGRTKEEAERNAHEAIALHLQGLRDAGHEIPERTSKGAYVTVPSADRCDHGLLEQSLLQLEEYVGVRAIKLVDTVFIAGCEASCSWLTIASTRERVPADRFGSLALSRRKEWSDSFAEA